jgi:hypothetical protein
LGLKCLIVWLLACDIAREKLSLAPKGRLQRDCHSVAAVLVSEARTGSAVPGPCAIFPFRRRRERSRLRSLRGEDLVAPENAPGASQGRPKPSRPSCPSGNRL